MTDNETYTRITTEKKNCRMNMCLYMAICFNHCHFKIEKQPPVSRIRRRRGENDNLLCKCPAHDGIRFFMFGETSQDIEDSNFMSASTLLFYVSKVEWLE